MATFEDLRMCDLVGRFQATVGEIAQTRNTSLFKKAGAELQNIYNFHLTADESFAEVEEYFKNMYSSFNYAAVIVNDALKKGALDKDSNNLLSECVEILQKCCRVITEKLKNK